MHSKRFLYTTTLFFLFISCQENSLNDEPEIDEDMLAATQFADDYFNSIGGRFGAESSITVLRFKDGKLLYATNTDDYKSYHEVTEETITATVEPGEYIFWYSGGGVTDLDDIDFEDGTKLPDEINPDLMWVIKIPEDIDDEFDDEDAMYLKYDIVYDFKGNESVPIRLDPKIKIQD